MTNEELTGLLHQAAEQTKDITDGMLGWSQLIANSTKMRANEDAQIYSHLADSFTEVLNPSIYARAMDPQGHKKTIRIEDHELTVVVTHREPTLEKIHGVDLFYNLGGMKCLAFQHKKRNKDGVFSFGKEESEQRDKIQFLCDACKRAPKGRESKSFVIPYCASVYVIGDSDGKIIHGVSACLVEQYRTHFYRSTSRGVRIVTLPSDLASIDKMFMQCLLVSVRTQNQPAMSTSKPAILRRCLPKHTAPQGGVAHGELSRNGTGRADHRVIPPRQVTARDCA